MILKNLHTFFLIHIFFLNHFEQNKFGKKLNINQESPPETKLAILATI
jgi:hypothetical protein